MPHPLIPQCRREGGIMHENWKNWLSGRIGFLYMIYKTLYTTPGGCGEVTARRGVQGFVDFAQKPYSSHLPKN